MTLLGPVQAVADSCYKTLMMPLMKGVIRVANANHPKKLGIKFEVDDRNRQHPWITMPRQKNESCGNRLQIAGLHECDTSNLLGDRQLNIVMRLCQELAFKDGDSI